MVEWHFYRKKNGNSNIMKEKHFKLNQSQFVETIGYFALKNLNLTPAVMTQKMNKWFYDTPKTLYQENFKSHIATRSQ